MSHNEDTYISKILKRGVTMLRRFPITKKYVDIILGDTDISQLLKGSWTVFIFKALSIPIGLATSLLISRWFGAKAVGLYGLVWLILAIITNIWMMGLWAAMPRFLSQIRIQENNGEPDIYRTMFMMLTLSWLILWGLVFLFSWYISTSIFDEPMLLAPLRYWSFMILIILLSKLNWAFLVASKNIYYAELLWRWIWPALGLWVLSIIYIYWPSDYGPIRASYLTWTLGLCISLYYIYRCNFLKLRGPLVKISKLLKISSPMLFTWIAWMIMMQIDTFMLGIYQSTETVWIYNVVRGIVSHVTLPLVLMTPVLWPQIADLFWSEKKWALQKLLDFSNKIIWYTSILFALILILWSWFILSIYWKEFLVWENIFILLSIANLVGALCGINGFYMNNCGHQNHLRYVTIIWLITNVILNYLLIPTYWLMWWAISTSCIIICTNIYLSAYLRRKEKVRTRFRF